MAHKLVNLIIRRISEHVVAIIVDQEFVFLPLSKWNSFSEFPIRLTVKLVSFDENTATLLSGFKKDQIGWHSLALRNLDNLADFYVFGADGHDAAHAPTLRRSLKHSILRVVQVLIPPKTIEIVHAFFNHGHYQYECKRCNISEKEADFEEGHKLTDGDQEEKHVEEEFELVVEHSGYKAEHIVFLVVQLIGAEVSRACHTLHIQPSFLKQSNNRFLIIKGLLLTSREMVQLK